jgi:phosphoglycerate dehydrogenase-like enzyme
VRVVYTDPAWALTDGGGPDLSLASLEREILGPEIELSYGVYDEGWVMSGKRLVDQVLGADAVVIYRCEITEELLAALRPTCRVVARSGVGYENLRPDLLAGAGIYGFHIPDYCGDEVSTHTVALLLALERGICVQDRLVRADQWGIHRGGVPRRTIDRTIGIVGFGRIGRATARKLQPLYRNILAYDPYVAADLMASYGVVPAADLATLLSHADAIVLHAALTPETTEIIDAEALAAVRPGTLLVNTARGRLVDTAAVLDALETKRLGGFASDVFSPEDPNASPVAAKLLGRDDVVVSSHRAFLSVESEASLRRRVAAGIRTVLVDHVPPPTGRLA